MAVKTVYTAIFSPYEELKEPTVVTPGWQYLCFTDQPFVSNAWQIIPRPMLPEGAQRTARYYKLMFHRHIDTEDSLWVDGSFTINTDLNEWWKRFRVPFTCIQHPVRNCFYTEAEACFNYKLDAPALIQKQINHYRRAGLPPNNGMISSGILMRRMDQKVIDFCDVWHDQVVNYSARDQLGFAFAAFKRSIHHVIKWDYRVQKEFIHQKHFHKRKNYGKNQPDQQPDQTA